MPWFEGTHTESRTLPFAPEAVRRHFSDPSVIVAQSADVASARIEGDTIHFVMKPEDHAGVMKFQGRFSCRYWLESDVLRWETAPGGNLIQEGEARFVARGEGTELQYRETVKVDLDLPAMMAPVLRPVITAMMTNGVQGYVKRMVASLT